MLSAFIRFACRIDCAILAARLRLAVLHQNHGLADSAKFVKRDTLKMRSSTAELGAERDTTTQ